MQKDLISEVHCMDNMTYMASIPDKFFDLVIADPPYGINFAKTNTGNGWIVRETKQWDKEIPKKEYFEELYRISKNQIIWGGNYMVEHIKPSMGWIFWDKGQRDFSLADGELAYTSFNKALRVFEMARGSHKAEDDKTGGKMHPTQKPVKLYKWCLSNYAKSGDKIFDPNMGSQSSRIACYDMGFDYYGCELDRDYFDAGNKRFNEHIKQGVLF